MEGGGNMQYGIIPYCTLVSVGLWLLIKIVRWAPSQWEDAALMGLGWAAFVNCLGAFALREIFNTTRDKKVTDMLEFPLLVNLDDNQDATSGSSCSRCSNDCLATLGCHSGISHGHGNVGCWALPVAVIYGWSLNCGGWRCVQ
jgi:hypothetical protein